MSVELIIISGRSGSGKTSVAFEMCEQLRQHNIPHANIDTDYLDDIWPEEEGPDLFLKNLAAIWSNYYHSRGCPRLILSGTATVIETDRIQQTIEQVCNGTPEGRVKDLVRAKVNAFILTAGDSVALERLGKREIGSTLERHVASSKKWDRLFADFPAWAHRVPAGGRDLEDIAAHVLQYAGWVHAE